MKLDDLIKAVDVKIPENYNKDLNIQISTDTRTIKEGDFYLPLKGTSFDGEKFISQAFEKGAVGAFCTKKHNNFDNALRIIHFLLSQKLNDHL